jgi:hypothetical protein
MFDALPPDIPLTLPPVSAPSAEGRYAYAYDGVWSLQPGSYFDADGHPYVVRVQVMKALPAKPRLCVMQHASGGYKVLSGIVSVPTDCDITIRGQDGQAKMTTEWQAVYGKRYPEWWSFDTNGVSAPQRRAAGEIHKVVQMFPQIDLSNRGIVVFGKSMGSGGMPAALLMPDPYRSKIAIVRGTIGAFLLPRLVIGYGTIGVKRWPADNDGGAGQAWWDSWDFSRLAITDPVLRGIHYRHTFSTTDNFASSATGNSQVHWVNVLEANKLSGAATWVAPTIGHAHSESGVAMPIVEKFEVPEQDVTLDRAHPAFTNSTGNWPLTAQQRIDVATYPRGHFNLGLTWDHAKIIDTKTEISIPIKYRARSAFGGGVPDQPLSITADVTPRRPCNFVLVDGETLRWQFGAQSGTAQVVGDTVTAVRLVMMSGEPYKPIRFFR